MKQLTWRKHHKWFGLLCSFFIVMFCLSGIILNHRTTVSGMNVSRKWLPRSYRFQNWNHGLVRGSLQTSIDDKPSILLYGDAGIWLTDSHGSPPEDFNKGLPQGADFRNIRNIVQTNKGELFSAGLFGLYHYNRIKSHWELMRLPMKEERLTDLVVRNDTLIAVGRSYLYVCPAPHRSFRIVQIKAAKEYDGKVSLFRTIWLLHSGELFGSFGKLLMDIIALILIVLCLTGVFYWYLPKHIKKRQKRGKTNRISKDLLNKSLLWHDKLGRWTLFLTLLIGTTGWCLRPPIMIALLFTKTSPIPGTVLDSSNAWDDRLRLLRFDTRQNEWLLSTSEGFYTLSSLEAIPVKLSNTPPVSIMGINVLVPDTCGNWLVGSFTGLYVWNRRDNQIRDYYTGDAPPAEKGSPFGEHAIAGYSNDFPKQHYIFDYQTGANFIPMPHNFAVLPISLWKLCVEIHTGRIYTFLEPATLVFIFVAGLLTVWILITGYKIRKRKKVFR